MKSIDKCIYFAITTVYDRSSIFNIIFYCAQINQQQLRYQDPSRKEAKNGVRAALGADFESKP